MSRRMFLSTGLLVTFTVGLIQLQGTRANAAKPVTWVGELTINAQSEDRVFSDSLGPIYRDYQVNGTSDLDNYCVSAPIDSAGNAFFRLDRRQGFANNLWCNQQVEAYKARTYTLKIQDLTACFELGLPPEGDFLDRCTLVSPVPPNATLQAHIWLDAVFKSKATKTPVTFDFTPLSGIAYRIVTDQDAPIVASTSDSRTVRYPGTGTAHLRYTGGATIGGPFPLPFNMIVKRIALP